MTEIVRQKGPSWQLARSCLQPSRDHEEGIAASDLYWLHRAVRKTISRKSSCHHDLNPKVSLAGLVESSTGKGETQIGTRGTEDVERRPIRHKKQQRRLQVLHHSNVIAQTPQGTSMGANIGGVGNEFNAHFYSQLPSGRSNPRTSIEKFEFQ